MDCLLLDRSIVLEGDMMVKSDQIYMQHGVESRPVFALNIMPELVKNLKISDLISLRKMKLPLLKIADKLPEYILSRGKSGFESPLDLISMNEMNREIQDFMDNFLPRLSVSNNQLITKCFLDGLSSSSARETYIVYVLAIWLKINSNRVKI